MKQLYSIIGIDGSGKDYQLERIMAEVGPVACLPLHCTAYHNSSYCANPTLSKILQKLGAEADRTSDAALKGISLFLKMLLFASELSHLQELHNAPVVLSTRHPAIDTPVYARFFLQHLKMSAEDQNNVFVRARSFLSPGEWALVSTLFNPEDERWSRETLPEFVVRTAALEWKAQFEVYTRIFGVPLPQKILFLNPSVETILKQLQRRKGSIKETHEQAAYLRHLKRYTEQALTALVADHPEIEVCTTDSESAAINATPLSFFALK